MNRKSNKSQSLIRLLMITIILILLNFVSGFVFTRFDLTSERRYSLSDSTKAVCRKLKDVIYFKIYLEGDLPPGFERLKNNIREMLDEFRVYSGENIDYQFIDPSADDDEKERIKLYKQLTQKGLSPANVEENEKAGRSQKIIFPGAIINYKNLEAPLQFLQSKIGSSPEEILNHSIEGLEYELTSTIRKLTNPIASKVGFLQGQNEIDTRHISSAARALGEFYKVDTVNIHGQFHALDDYQALIVAGPKSAFDEKDKFIIDQFVMKGGRILWLIDQMQMNMDSLQESGENIAVPYELNLDDLLFRYGVRVNPDLVLDLQAAPIVLSRPGVTSPQQELFPWYYFPLLNPERKHPIVHNLNAIKCEFASSLDTIETAGVSKTILLTTSKFSRLQYAPAKVSLDIIREEADPKDFKKGNVPIAVLLEGIFQSDFINRVPDSIRNSPEIGFRESSTPGKMIVISDADVITNFVSRKGAIYPLGYDRFTKMTYGNLSFIMNCMDYLCDESGILNLRGKELKLRLLDPASTADPLFIQWINVLVPVLLVILYGMIRFLYRKRKYTRTQP